MSPRAYYNEIDPAAAHVLRTLIADGVIAPGDVDTRSIKDVSPDDLNGYTQCHFFAGFGGWSIAARMAGWPDDRHIWTGSCPCQPFSVAGKGAGTADVRHLWPDFHRIIRAARPVVVVGEQVAGKAGYGWFDGVAADLARENYASRCVDIPACAVDAPHIRQRLYWCAMADGASEERYAAAQPGVCRQAQGEWAWHGQSERPYGVNGGLLDHGIGAGRQGHAGDGDSAPGRRITAGPTASADVHRNGSFYSDADLLACHDGKARRAKSGLRLLVDGVPGRIDAWRLAGNGIVLPLAAEVIAALMDVLPKMEAA